MKFLKDQRLQMAYLSFGSNLGDRNEYIQAAMVALERDVGIIYEKSSFYETEPVGELDQPWFLNCCVEVETKLLPQKLLAACQTIEAYLGRERKIRCGPRTIDIDILFYGSQVIKTDTLCIPHPEITHRRFVLVPLVEIARNFVHPILKKSIQELLKECPDTSIVRALHGNPSTQKTCHAVPDRHSLGRS